MHTMTHSSSTAVVVRLYSQLPVLNSLLIHSSVVCMMCLVFPWYLHMPYTDSAAVTLYIHLPDDHRVRSIESYCCCCFISANPVAKYTTSSFRRLQWRCARRIAVSAFDLVENHMDATHMSEIHQFGDKDDPRPKDVKKIVTSPMSSGYTYSYNTRVWQNRRARSCTL